MKILTEASGSVASSFLIKNIQVAGWKAVASDISLENAGSLLADDYIKLPKSDDDNLWNILHKQITEKGVNVVIPSLDDTLSQWNKQSWLKDEGVKLILSPQKTIETFVDKWKAYEFFVSNGIPTPKTSLNRSYPLLKPRLGRGGEGIFYNSEDEIHFDMKGYLSQEKIDGVEYTVDVLCSKDGDPVYIVPRRRGGVISGKSTTGELINHPKIIEWVKNICQKIKFIGPVNFQCFENESGIYFIEINPRIASGMALSFAGTLNWLEQTVNNIVFNKPIQLVNIRWGLRMYRSYQEHYSL